MKIETHDPTPENHDPRPELVEGQIVGPAPSVVEGLTITVRNPHTGELTTNPADCDVKPQADAATVTPDPGSGSIE